MRILPIALAALGVVGCYSTGDGPDPSTALYFPVGMVVSPGGHALYVANSDFDLQFNAGTVDAYRLDDLRKFFEKIWSVDSGALPSSVCDELGLGVNGAPILYPGACNGLSIDAPPANYFAIIGNQNRPIAQSSRIGAFATDVLFVCNPPDDATLGGADCSSTASDPRGARLFVPVRGDPSITYFDVDDDRAGGTQSFHLDCGQPGNGRCADSHRIGIDPGENTRGLQLPTEPFGIAVSDRADAIAVTHQIPGGAVSLITGNGGSVMIDKPRLEFVAGGLPAATTGIVAIPIPALVPAMGATTLANYQEGFVATYRGAARADVFRFFDDDLASPARPFVSLVGGFNLAATPSGIDSRGVAIDRTDKSPRIACERACTQGNLDCLKGCTRIPLSVFVANRAPSALLLGDMTTPNPTGSTEFLQFYDSVPLPQGPSRVIVGKITNPLGDDETRVFAVSFDARTIYIYDPQKRRIDGQIRTGRGPHALVMDPVAPIAYVGHFTDSYIGLIDLDQRHPGSYASIVATIGVPQPPKESN